MLGKVLAPYKTPPFTLPFNISTIAFMLAAASMHNVEISSVREPALPNYNSTEELGVMTASAFFGGTVRGLGQV
jgi:urea transporter